MKHEWRKKEKNLYVPKNQPEIIEVPEFKFLSISGEGNPNSEYFSECVQALYSLAYGVRMSYKWEVPPKEYYDYTVYPLEGIWNLIDPTKHIEGQLDKDNLKFELMIRQPDFLDDTLFEQVMEIVSKKKTQPQLKNVAFEKYTEGTCVQMLHIGSYDLENESFKLMEDFCKSNGYKRLEKSHREIYLSNPQSTAPEKLKTVLRFKIA